MTNVSKKTLKPEYEKKLLQQFSKLFAHADAKYIEGLFEDVLTPSEKIMLVKRVAIIIMLSEGFSTYKVAKTLSVSDATVRNLQRSYKDKDFTKLLKITKSKTFDSKNFWKTIDVLLRLGMPPMGRGRWQFLNKV